VNVNVASAKAPVLLLKRLDKRGWSRYTLAACRSTIYTPAGIASTLLTGVRIKYFVTFNVMVSLEYIYLVIVV